MFFWKRRDHHQEFDEPYAQRPLRERRDQPLVWVHLSVQFLLAAVVVGLVWATSGRDMAEKTVKALLTPIGLVWMLVSVGIWFSVLHRRGLSALLLIVVWTVLSVGGNRFVADALVHSLENRWLTASIPSLASSNNPAGGETKRGPRSAESPNSESEDFREPENPGSSETANEDAASDSIPAAGDDGSAAETAGKPENDAGRPSSRDSTLQQPGDADPAAAENKPSDTGAGKDPVQPFDLIVVLGGGTTVDPTFRPQLTGAGDRVMMAARLYHEGRAKRICVTGEQTIRTDARDPDPAEEARDLLRSIGVPADAIHALRGVNTSEEIRSLKTWLRSQPGNEDWRIGLVTSAWHMDRALALARKNGLDDLVPVPAHFLSQPFTPDPSIVIPSAGNLETTARMLHEYLGRWISR